MKKRSDKQRDKHRPVIGRFFGAIKRLRRIATRYEKKGENFLCFAWLAAVMGNWWMSTTA